MEHQIHKIELHSHLEGTITANTLVDLARNGREHMLPTLDKHELHALLTAPGHDAFWKYFTITRPFRRTLEDIRHITCAELDRAVTNHVIYAEYRFNPLGPARDGTDPWDILHTIREIMATYEHRYGLKTSLLFGIAREEGPKNIHYGLDIAYEAWQEGLVAGIDLNGNEHQFPTELFIPSFTRIKTMGCPLTIHAGEWAGPESVRAALACGARRIGHGARSIEDIDLMHQLKSESITLELCPTSNVYTGVFPSFQNHPIRQLYDAGIPITINSDDSAPFHSDITSEYSKVMKVFQLTVQDIHVINTYAIAASFVSDPEKENLMKAIV